MFLGENKFNMSKYLTCQLLDKLEIIFCLLSTLVLEEKSELVRALEILEISNNNR